MRPVSINPCTYGWNPSLAEQALLVQCVNAACPLPEAEALADKLHAWEVRVVKRSGKSDVETTEQVR